MNWYDLNHLLSPTQQTDSPIAVSPAWSRHDFVVAVWMLRTRLQQHSIKAVALYCDDAAIFACVLLACIHADIDVYLPPDLTETNQKWAEENADIWFANQNISHAQKPIWFNLEFESNDRLPEKDQWLIPQSTTQIYLKTSGSNSKGQTIAKSVAQMQAEAEALLPHVSSLVNVDAAIGSVSTQHLYGLSFRIVLSLLAAWPIFRHQQAYPESLLMATTDYPKSVWISSPTLLNALAEHHLDNTNFSPVLIVSAGGVLPLVSAQKIAQHIRMPWEIYGSTETGVIAHRRGDAAWQFFDCLDYGINENNALWVKSAWTKGLEQTADGVHFHTQGFELLGRIDRIIKLADKRISLAQMETHFLTHKWLVDAYCGIHPKFRRIVAWLALNEQGIVAFREQGRPFVVNELKKHIARWYERTAQPRFWRFDVQLPRNSQSKIQQAAFQAACQERPTVPIWEKRPCDTQKQEYDFMATVPLDLHYFGGHFAEFPLVPGVVQLQWVMDLARQVFSSLPLRVIRVENLKFQQFLRPNDEVSIHLSWLPEKQKMVFTVKNSNKPCASGRVVFSDEGDY